MPHKKSKKTLTLFCYVRGDKGKQITNVEVDKAPFVADLKAAIKERYRPRFDDIPSDSLILWKFSVLINKDLKNVVEARNLLKVDSLDDGHKILSEIFPSALEKNSVHIIIDRPHSGELRLHYFLS
jgi:hypothetical protein